MLNKNNPKINRQLIYFFYDPQGIIDEYISVILTEMKKYVSEILFVSNGELKEEEQLKIKKFTSNILIRKNIGFDVWAYKDSIEYLGWKEIEKFDEVIFMNFTIMGPLYPFSEMFQKMDKKEIDFWGLTLYHGAPFDPFGKIKYGYLPLHIQSHFIAVRKSMLCSKEFYEYWSKIPVINSYEEAICYHEAIFTKYFEDLGFHWDVYVDTRDLVEHSFCPILMSPLELIKNRRCPIIKRRSFFHNYYDFLNFTNGECTIEVFEYIQKNLAYDINLIWDNILRLQNQADIKHCLHLNYILPSDVKKNPNLDIKSKRIALVIHIYFQDLIQYCYNYALSMPDSSDLYITTDTIEKKQCIEKIFAKGCWNKVEVILIQNRGRDVSALLVATKSFIMNYDFVCFAHDKKVKQLYMSIKGESFSYKCFENILKSKIFVENIINLFEENERLGFLTPPPPNFAEYYPTLGRIDWGCNYTNTEREARKLGITVNFDYEKEPIAPLGTMFWFRPKAMKKLFEADWNYSNFPKEPNQQDGTLLHAIERLYPFVVQSENYYPAWLMVDSFARIEVTNLYFMLKEVNKAAFSLYEPNTFYNLVNRMRAELMLRQGNNQDNETLFKILLKDKLRKKIPNRLWIFVSKTYRKFGGKKWIS